MSIHTDSCAAHGSLLATFAQYVRPRVGDANDLRSDRTRLYLRLSPPRPFTRKCPRTREIALCRDVRRCVKKRVARDNAPHGIEINTVRSAGRLRTGRSDWRGRCHGPWQLSTR
jgi:hypothetical protein